MDRNINSEKSVSLSELKCRLLDLNHHGDMPFSVIEDNDKLIASWKIVDAKWIELFGVAGLKKQYELTLLFDEVNNRVRYREKSTDIETEISTDRIGFKKQFQWGYRKEFEFGKSWGMKIDGTLGQQYSYKFNTADIKNPVFGIINKSGWQLQKSFMNRRAELFAWLIVFAVLVGIVFCFT